MPPKPRPWFRVYVELFGDPKMSRLTPTQRWLWISLLGQARKSSRGGKLMVSDAVVANDYDLASFAQIHVRDVRRGLPVLESLDMIHRDPEDGSWVVTRWSDRQYESDDVTARTRKHRSIVSDATFQPRSIDPGWNVPKGDVGTPPETDTETDTPQPPAKRGARRRRPVPPNEFSDPLAGAREALLTDAHRHMDELDRTPPDPERNVTAIARIRDQHHLATATAFDPTEDPFP